MTSNPPLPAAEGATLVLTASVPLGREEARHLCQATLAGTPAGKRSLLVEVDARGAHLIAAAGAEPIAIWTLGLDGLEEDRAVADALGRARLGLLRAWWSRGLVILGRADVHVGARRRQAALLRALARFLSLDALDAAMAIASRAA
jgi:hypothetical protein